MRKVLKYLKPYRTAAILTVFLVLLHSLSQLILPSMMADIINEGITRGELSYIWRVGTIMPVSYTHLTLPTNSRV